MLTPLLESGLSNIRRVGDTSRKPVLVDKCVATLTNVGKSKDILDIVELLCNVVEEFVPLLETTAFRFTLAGNPLCKQERWQKIKAINCEILQHVDLAEV